MAKPVTKDNIARTSMGHYIVIRWRTANGFYFHMHAGDEADWILCKDEDYDMLIESAIQEHHVGVVTQKAWDKYIKRISMWEEPVPADIRRKACCKLIRKAHALTF